MNTYETRIAFNPNGRFEEERAYSALVVVNHKDPTDFDVLYWNDGNVDHEGTDNMPAVSYSSLCAEIDIDFAVRQAETGERLVEDFE